MLGEWAIRGGSRVGHTASGGDSIRGGCVAGAGAGWRARGRVERRREGVCGVCERGLRRGGGGARYPELLRYAGIEGGVLLGFDLLSDGRVADVHVIRSDPPFLFDLSAALSLSRWYYKPFGREGEQVNLSFSLEH